MKWTPNDSEYAAVRNEITARIQIINTQENTALLMAAGFWASGVVLFSEAERSPVLLFISVVLLYAPVLFLIPISIKSGENIYQIAVLAAYTKVFYVYASIVGGGGERPLYLWEFANSKTFRVKTLWDKNKAGRFLQHFVNNAYSSIAFVSLTIYLFVGLSILNGAAQTLLTPFLYKALYAAFTASLLLGFVLTYQIYRWSSAMDNLQKPERDIVDKFVRCGIELGLFDPKEKERHIQRILEADLTGMEALRKKARPIR